jgi:ATP-dependent DNA helicase HFM1/MER3
VKLLAKTVPFQFHSTSIAGTLRSAELKPELPNVFFASQLRESQALESMQRLRMDVPSRGTEDTPFNANDRGADDSIENYGWLFDDLETGMPPLNLP